MYGEDPSAFQRQYQGEQRQQRPPEGGQQRGGQPMEQPQGQQYAASEAQQYGTQQGMGGQQGMRGKQGRGGQQGMQGRQAGQAGMQGQQGMAGQATSSQRGMSGQQGMQAAGGMQAGGMQGQQARGAPSTGGAQLQSVSLEEVAREEVVTVEPDETITNVAVELADKDVGSVVVTRDGEPMGVLTDRKIALTLGEMPDVADRTAGDLVSEGVITAKPDMTIYEAVQTLRDEGVRRLPIVDDDGELDGIVTLDDVIVLVAGELGAAAEVIEKQAPPR